MTKISNIGTKKEVQILGLKIIWVLVLGIWDLTERSEVQCAFKKTR
jgi:hypothetical protein